MEWVNCICLEFNGCLLILVNRDKFLSDDGLVFNQALAYYLQENLLMAGMSRPFAESRYIRSAYEQAEAALRYGLEKNPHFWYFRFDDYVLSYILDSCKGDCEPEFVCSEKLLALLQHDAKKNTEYYKTLKIYFACKFNAVATAKILSIQRSSFFYRMDKIKELVDIDLDSNDELLYLLISFRILEGYQDAKE